jgi:hypothetical protein
MKTRSLRMWTGILAGVLLLAAAPLLAAPQRRPKSEAERDAIRTMIDEKEPGAKVAKAEAFLRDFPDSDLKDIAYLVMSDGFHDLRDSTQALAAARKAVEFNPHSSLGYFTLGIENLNIEPRDINMAFWCMARGTALARAEKSENAAGMEKQLRELYVSFAGNDDGLEQLIQQAEAAPWPPADFHLPDPPLYGADRISPRAVVQGGLGSCYFHSPIAALAQTNPQKIPPMIKDNGDGTFTVTFADKKTEKAYMEDLRYARSSGFDRSSGLWVGVLFRAYAQRILREAMLAAIDKSDLFSLLKPYAKEYIGSSDDLLLAYDRAIRSVVNQSAQIDRAKLEAALQEEVKPLPISAEVKAAGLKIINSSGVYEAIEATVRENGEIFGAYRAVGHGGHPARVMAAFLGGKPVVLSSKEPDKVAQLLQAVISEGAPVVAGTSPKDLEQLQASVPLPPSAKDWYVPGHAYTVLDVNASTRQVTLRNPWGRKPDPDGIFTIPIETFLEVYPMVATIIDEK